MLTRYMRAEICLVIYTVLISAVSVSVAGLMHAAIHLA